MSKPSLATIRYYQVHGKLPKKAKSKSTKQPEPKEPEQSEEWPKESGGGWWQLSNGKKIQDEEKARKAQAELS